MYKGKRLEESSIIHKSFTNSVLNETTNQVFEREIDNYTRMLEQDKRKFFRVQENRNEVVKAHTKKIKQLDTLKSRSSNTEMVKLKARLKTLENDLDKSINTYNHVICSNKKLKGQIDQLRKEKHNQKQVMQKIIFQINEFNELIEQEQTEIARRKDTIEQDKQGILTIKAENQSLAKAFRNQVGSVRGSLGSSNLGSQMLKRKSQAEQQKEATDSLPLVRYRLRHLLTKNKERVKIIDNYKRTMDAIRRGFEEIKEESGIGDLQEITSIFLKQEQQNHLIYEYIDKLGRDSQDLNEQIQQIREQIVVQKESNEEYLNNLGSTPKKELLKMQKMKMEENCNTSIQQFENFLLIAANELKILDNCQTELTRFNLTDQLAKLQHLIDEHYTAGDDMNVVFHEEMTKYTKAPPGYTQELRDNREQKLLDGQKLREYASDFWQKRRAKPQSK